jgi:hypothetical protein
MKTLTAIVYTVSLLITASPAADATLRFAVMLKDSSRVIGVPLRKSLQLKTSFSTETLPFDQIRNITFDVDHKRAIVRMTNDNRLHGEILQKSLQLETLIGRLTVPLSAILSLMAIPESSLSAAGLLAWYPFDGDVDDASGNNHNGENHGSMPGADRFGVADRARAFDGERSCVTAARTTDLNFPPAPFSVSVWTLVADEAADYAIVAKHDPGYFNGYVLWARGSIYGFYLSADPRLEAPVPAGAGIWHHVVGVYDGTKEYLYVDGSIAGQCVAPAYSPNNAPIEIGRAYDRNYFKGSIDDVRIYNRALSAGEVLELFHEGGWGGKK